jgi:hypothetical protein
MNIKPTKEALRAWVARQLQLDPETELYSDIWAQLVSDYYVDIVIETWEDDGEEAAKQAQENLLLRAAGYQRFPDKLKVSPTAVVGAPGSEERSALADPHQGLIHLDEHALPLTAADAARSRAISEYLAFKAESTRAVVDFRREFTGGKVLPVELAREFLLSRALSHLPLAFFRQHHAPVLGHHTHAIDARRWQDSEGFWRAEGTMQIGWDGGTCQTRYECQQTRSAKGMLLQAGSFESLETPGHLLKMRSWEEMEDGPEGEWVYLIDAWPRCTTSAPIGDGAGDEPQPSVLSQLRRLSLYLANRYHWRPMDATWFVLTGFVPTVRPATWAIEYVGCDDHQYRQVILKYDPWLSIESLKMICQHIRQEMLGDQGKPLGKKAWTLFQFVFRRKQADPSIHWATFCDQWNSENLDAPEERRYKFWNSMPAAYHRAERALKDQLS